LHRILESSLYHTYVDDPSRGTLRPFIRTLIERPDLALHVEKTDLQVEQSDRSAELSLHRAEYPIHTIREEEPSLCDIAQSVRFRTHGDCSTRQLWLQELEQGLADAELALLLVLVSNLSELHLVNSFFKPGHKFFRMAMMGVSIHSAYGMSHALSTLRKVKLSLCARGDSDPKLIASLLQSESLQELEIETLAAISEFYWQFWDCPEAVSNIQHLKFSNVNLSVKLIARLVRSCK